MRRSPLRRTKPMYPGRRSWPMDWRDREDRSEEFASRPSPKPLVKAVMAKDLQARTPMVVDKEHPLECEPYRAYVRRLPCWLCHIEGYTQFAHADFAKGMGIKSDDRGGAPLCGPHPMVSNPRVTDPGCHWLVGTAGSFSKASRRELEVKAAADTQQRLRDWAATDTVLRELLQRIGVM